jgi:hypothetical protein
MLMVVARETAFVVAINPPAVPIGTPAPLSATRVVMRRLPDPIVSSRTSMPAGTVQSVVVEDLSAQWESSQERGSVTVTVGVGWLVTAVVSERVANLATGSVVEVPP